MGRKRETSIPENISRLMDLPAQKYSDSVLPVRLGDSSRSFETFERPAMIPKATFQRTITNELHSLESLMNAITNYLEDQGVDAQAVYRINLAMEEIITNIIKYGYDDYDRHNIQVLLSVQEDEIIASIEDYGHAFNPLERVQAAAQTPSVEPVVGGLGLHLVKQLLDDVTYRRDGERNVLEIKSRRTLPGSLE